MVECVSLNFVRHLQCTCNSSKNFVIYRIKPDTLYTVHTNTFAEVLFSAKINKLRACPRENNAVIRDINRVPKMSFTPYLGKKTKQHRTRLFFKNKLKVVALAFVVFTNSQTRNITY